MTAVMPFAIPFNAQVVQLEQLCYHVFKAAFWPCVAWARGLCYNA